MKTFSIKTLGCKLNQYDSALMAQQFLQAGLQQVKFGQNADIVLVNTCTVTNRSDKKCRNYICQGARSSYDGKVYVSGCLIERAGHEISSMDAVKKVFGTRNKESIVPEILSDINCVPSGELNSRYLVSPNDRSRAFLKIQDGCDGKCSYCIIPAVRGIPSSRDYDEILENVKILEQNNINEIVLTGITIGKYDHEGRNLADLVRGMISVSEKMRFRITSIEPVHIDDSIISLFSNERICSHIHLPLQSGSDRILNEMNRPYTAADYLEIASKLRTVRTDIALGTDVIVGFPGETDDDFTQTLDILERAGIAYIHQFTFSPRSGTPAALRDDFCTDTDIYRRSETLRKFSQEKKSEYQKKFLNRVLNGIIEMDSTGYWATTENYIHVRLHPDKIPVQGTAARILITSVNDVPEGIILP
ncbi:MAG: tRNA (N(6)-L-threonylcarbamoyladenosine(37)-C(2))-methylthiotransferase MtaB [Spirochaetes bacterium]|nr:tRNA (N(6)-L-threonylcarbamoyladenosine(37)-C(2))-methylthiotransferase MtaB [Spirochaetota bacterium]